MYESASSERIKRGSVISSQREAQGVAGPVGRVAVGAKGAEVPAEGAAGPHGIVEAAVEVALRIVLGAPTPLLCM